MCIGTIEQESTGTVIRMENSALVLVNRKFQVQEGWKALHSGPTVFASSQAQDAPYSRIGNREEMHAP